MRPIFVLNRHEFDASGRLPTIHMHQRHYVTPECFHVFLVRVHFVHFSSAIRMKKPLPQPRLLMDPFGQPYAFVDMAERLLIPRIVHKMPPGFPLGRVIHQPVPSDERNGGGAGCALAFVVHVQ
jgi:hypothetical protein